MKTKGRCRNQPPRPLLVQGGEFPQAPLLGGGGVWGWWDFAAFATFAPWRETGCVMTKTTEQSENVYENKG